MCDNTLPVPDLSAVPGISPANPLSFLDPALAGVRQYHAVMAALDLGLFKVLREPKTGPECALALGCRPEIVTLICEGLVSLGLLEKTKEQYRDSGITLELLVEDAPFSQQHAIVFQRKLAGFWADLPRIARDGPVTCDRAQMFRDVIIPSMAEHCRCGLLRQVTARVEAVPEFSSAKKLLDLGGGHGLYSIAFCQKNPDLHAVVFDLPPVTGVTRDFISRYRADRVSVLSGDFFKDPIGSGYDIIFSSSNPGGRVPELIPKIADAIRPGGLFINKQATDDAAFDPWLSLEWNLWTFKGVQKQAARYVFANSVPVAEYNRLLSVHGFVVREIVPIDAQSAMTIAEKVTS
ncbi:methyltransferase [Methanoregula sp.]|uniref:methyltransferase n=1 Tax=Methanoregula sp. TaxID=2052170 RepID=UPI003564B704